MRIQLRLPLQAGFSPLRHVFRTLHAAIDEAVCSMEHNEVRPLPCVREVAGPLRTGPLQPQKAPSYHG